MFNVPVRHERVRDWERGCHGVHLLRGLQWEQRWTVHSVWGGDLQERDWECIMHGMSIGKVSGRHWPSFVRELRGQRRFGGE